MNDRASDMNKPESQFVERLEWQLTSAFRRASRLTPMVRKVAIPRRLAAAALLVCVLLTGVAVSKAADYVKDSWRRKIEVARAERDVILKRAHLESILRMEKQAGERIAAGVIEEEEYRALKTAAEGAEYDLKRSRLDLEEVKKSGVAPRNELYAPKVGGRDYVSERLELELKAAELDLGQMERRLNRFADLAEEKMIRTDRLALIQGETEGRRLKIGGIRRRLELRKKFLEGELSAEEAEVRELLTDAEKSLKMHEARIEAIKAELKRLETLEAKGLISQGEVDRLKYELDAAQAEKKLAALEVDILEKVR
jgi:hypothetical protein